MKALCFVLILYPFFNYGQKLIHVGNLDAQRLSSYKISISKKLTSTIRKIDSTYARSPLNQYDSLVENYIFSNELAIYRYEVPFRYRTNNIILSGLVLVPKYKSKDKDLLYLHGTRPPWGFLAIPSDFSIRDKPKKMFYELKYLFMLADLGYTIFIPDYIGYGNSNNVEHPYTVLEPNVVASHHSYTTLKHQFDSLLINKKGLVSCGVSEGGGYALGLHNYMEKIKDSTFVVSYPCEGAYDYRATLKWVFDNKPKSKFGILVYVWSAYSQLEYYYPDSPLRESFFRIKNISQKKIFKIKRFIGKNKTPFKYVDKSIAEKLVNEYFEEFNVISKENTIFDDWTPTGGVTFFHSEQDELVPIINTQNAFESLSARSKKVNVYYLHNKGHKTLIDTYFGFLIKELR